MWTCTSQTSRTLCDLRQHWTEKLHITQHLLALCSVLFLCFPTTCARTSARSTLGGPPCILMHVALAPDGTVLDKWFNCTVIHSCCKLSYGIAQGVIEGRVDPVTATSWEGAAPEEYLVPESAVCAPHTTAEVAHRITDLLGNTHTSPQAQVRGGRVDKDRCPQAYHCPQPRWQWCTSGHVPVPYM